MKACTATGFPFVPSLRLMPMSESYKTPTISARSPYQKYLNDMTKTRVRFHLAQGPNFKNWQVKCGDNVEYYDPAEYNLHMENCKLRNQPATAKKIYDGANKTVCAWIECDSVTAYPSADRVPRAVDFLYYNPKRKPYWHLTSGVNADDRVFDSLSTQGQMVVISSQ